MKRRLLLVLPGLLIAGCGGTPKQYGTREKVRMNTTEVGELYYALEREPRGVRVLRIPMRINGQVTC